MACISKALIVGGGIAGLSSAIALSRAGVSCDVVELGEAFAGASIGINGRAADALGELGVYDDCFATSRPFERDSVAGSMRDADGRIVSAGPPRPDWPGSKTGLGVYRPAFLKTLSDAAKREGADIRLRMSIKAIEESEAGALVWFSDDSQRSYDLVVGADGINSVVRSIVFPDAPKPAYSGQFSVRWMVPGAPIEEEGWYVSPVGRIGFYNLPQGYTYVPTVFDIPELRRLSEEEVHAKFSALLDSFSAPAMLELKRRFTPEADLIVRPFEWLLVPGPWHRGRTLLLGDAAHATTAHLGMGGGMALEDAVVLGQCIAGASTLDSALETFMTRRFERVRLVVETSLALSRLEQQNAPRGESMELMKKALIAIAEPY